MSFDLHQCRNESEVESKLIVQYLLPQLGYTPDTWHQEVAFGNIRLDFLAFATQVLPFVVDARSPLSIVLEAKHPKENLDKHLRKLKRYVTSLYVRYGVLTNGKELRIYERIESDIQLCFQCAGVEIEDRIGEIEVLIGRDSLQGAIADSSQTAQTNPPPLLEVSTTRSKTKSPRKNSMKTIAIYHHKGGVGKTTVSINLAAALRNKGKRVLLIDIDAQANTTFATGLVKFQFEEDDNLRERNVYHLLESSQLNFIPEIVRKSSYFNQPEIDVIPSHITLIERQMELTRFASTTFRLAKKLEKVSNDYDVVIIDTPPSLDLYAQTALTAADYLIIPSDLKPFSNQGLRSVTKFVKQEINETKEGLGKPPLEILGVLPSKISTNNKYLEHTFPKQRKVIPERYKLPLMDNMISERVALSHCINQTLPVGNLDIPDPKSIIEYAKDNSTADISAAEFEALAIEVLSKIGMQ